MIPSPPTTCFVPGTRNLKRLFTILLSAAALLTGACGFNKSGIVIPAYLETVGWQDNATLLEHGSFSDYATAVQREVLRSRVPFVVDNAASEAMLASPAEYPTAAHCDTTHGIALLVHGRSDTAISMRGLALSMSEHCYIARTVLLPGHGTRPGDLLSIRLADWTDTVQYLLAQAAREHDHVVAIGFSLGAVLLLTEAIQPDSPIDAVVTISPAFHLTTSPWADLTRWLHPVRRWLDKEKPDDTYRYEAIPTIAVAQTIQAKNRVHRALKRERSVELPWLMVQSENDLVIRTEKNRQLFANYASHRASQSITFYGLSEEAEISAPEQAAFVKLAGFNRADRVSGLTHVAIHQSPANHHYGRAGDYRNCGTGGPRTRPAVHLCEQAERPWLGPWNEDAPDEGAYGMSTYNPQFDELSDYLFRFLSTARQSTASQ